MQLYARPGNSDHQTNCAAFETFMRRFEWAKFHQPNAATAPWHVQCHIPTDVGYVLTLNFWPHLLKGQYEGFNGGKSVIGLDDLRAMMISASQDTSDDFSVFEE